MYGIGAAIVIFGAMAKFLDMKYSNEIFIIGLGVEVVVFAISSIEFSSDEEDEAKYHWENVFPELLKKHDEDMVSLRGAMPESDYTDIIAQKQMLTMKLKEIQQNIDHLNNSFNSLTNSTDFTNQSMVNMNIANQDYEKHMQALRQNMASMNEFFKAFNSAVESVK